MSIRISGLAAALALALAAAPAANAQEVGSGPATATPERMAEMIALMMRQLEPFARENNLHNFNGEVQAVLETHAPAALIVIPADKAEDPTFEWAGGLRFDTGYDVPQDGVLTPSADHPIFGDAQACSAANEGRTVAHFRRIREGAMLGHVCTLGYVEEDKAILVTRTVVQGGGRRAWSNFESFARVLDAPQSAVDLLEPVIEGNVVLAEAFDAVMMRNLPLATPNRPAGTPAQP